MLSFMRDILNLELQNTLGNCKFLMLICTRKTVLISSSNCREKTPFWMEYKFVLSDIFWKSSSGRYLKNENFGYLILCIDFISDFLVSPCLSKKSIIFSMYECIYFLFVSIRFYCEDFFHFSDFLSIHFPKFHWTYFQYVELLNQLFLRLLWHSLSSFFVI